MGPPPVDLTAQSCWWDPASGDLVTEIRVVGLGALEAARLDATADTQVMTVKGAYADGRWAELPWSLETTRSGPTLTLHVTTASVPTTLSITHLSVTVVQAASIEAPSIEAWKGKALSMWLVRATVRDVMVQSNGIGVELSIRPPVVKPSLVVVGLQGLHADVAGHSFLDEGLTGGRGAPSECVQRVVLLAPPGDQASPGSGAAELSADGVMVQYPNELTIQMPTSCSS